MKNINSLCIKDALLLLRNWLKQASRKCLALSLPGGGQLKHSLSDCQPRPTPWWDNNNTEMVALAPSKVAFQLLGTSKEKNDSLAAITHVHTKAKTRGLFCFSLLTPAMNCLVQKDDWTYHWLCQLLPHLWRSKAHGRVAVDHVFVAPACFHKPYCPLESSLCRLLSGTETRIAEFPPGSQLTGPCDTVSSGIFWYDRWFSC